MSYSVFINQIGKLSAIDSQVNFTASIYKIRSLVALNIEPFLPNETRDISSRIIDTQSPLIIRLTSVSLGLADLGKNKTSFSLK